MCGFLRLLGQKSANPPASPGAAVDKGESPSHAAARELREELGITATVGRGLAVDWVSATEFGAPPVMRFPGETVFVYDGGVWDEARIAAVRLPDHEVTAIEFVEPARLPELMAPGDARRALSALRARLDAGGTVLLEDGRPTAPSVLDRAGVLRTARRRSPYDFHPGPAPDHLAVRQSWGWLFAPDGRVLVLLGPDTGSACLPGGTPEPEDGGDPVATLIREADEEAAATLGEPIRLGYLSDPGEPCARLRYAAPLRALGPSRTDPATGHTYIRVLATPEQALELFDWGPQAAGQLAAAHRARELLGIPRAEPRPFTEIDGPADWRRSSDPK
ncbi:NUDIX hydrolase [Streptomyces sp. ITFR-16]|uniref:NUDIX hydrolase n=1 Tax=Streptomyces sp. ITFR-16 TaxID=3075198 RepID=UPI00288C3C74|nr:NUDIX hydrolase [Streptomyces sp. ITFR-16]WNI20812.1 NUDIX hydrolase [Streptomyces sp. ITFR-16]